jgi:hypothetical protein
MLRRAFVDHPHQCICRPCIIDHDAPIPQLLGPLDATQVRNGIVTESGDIFMWDITHSKGPFGNSLQWDGS